MSQVNRLMPLWTATLCLLRVPASVNVRKHTSQAYRLSPLWIRLCLVRSLLWTNALLQMLHVYRLWSLWISLCLFRLDVHLNAFLQTSQLNRLMPLWTASLWQLSLRRHLNVLWHTSHSCGLSAVCVSWEVEFLYICSHVLLLYIRSVSSFCWTCAPLNISWPALRNWHAIKLDNTSSSSSFTSTSLPFITLLCDKLDDTSLYAVWNCTKQKNTHRL